MRPAPIIKIALRTSTLHRRLGMGAALFVLLLALSGLLLNHGDTLALDQRQIDSPLLLNWYGIEIPDQASHFSSGDNRVSQLGEQLYFNSQPLQINRQPLMGIHSTEQLTVVALSNTLLLLSNDGELLERIDTLPQGMNAIDAIGSDAHGNIHIRQGQQIAVADSELLSWQNTDQSHGINWSQPGPVDVAYITNITENYRQQTLDYERVLLDLHSGRLFGRWGPYVMDGAALAMLVLAVTGFKRGWQRSGKKVTHNYNSVLTLISKGKPAIVLTLDKESVTSSHNRF